ncbi:glycosyltransferase family 2 protein [Kordia sp. YSTF-M3]|uniref:Glycosyltransferase family 2 protein n=1 Tax=Kordia aestuariivivens TaxID=2759037 RepID=A0ABR7QCE3_9FLAO|nr:glycosyltransferase [Kordia aestuariivivens]MBC8756068.1 glycosyltransferase family 2 protein [Kordia aestuariivivens]
MLSVLIPTYNYDISTLVEEIHSQLILTDSIFEILCFDDHSTNLETIKQNQRINSFSNASYTVLPENIGRSRIRNLLAQKATYDWLLFLDADVIPAGKDFITKYVETISDEKEVIYGGILYQEKKPKQENVLRWVYGKEREALSVKQRNEASYLRFLTLSFLIKKDVFHKVKFNEDIPNARHEDTLFANDLKHAKVHLTHIHNPVYHLGLDTSAAFIRKSMESVEVLILFLKNNLIEHNDILITKVFSRVKKFGLHPILSVMYKWFGKRFEKNLLSNNPSMFIFDLYRLTYLCYLDKRQ